MNRRRQMKKRMIALFMAVMVAGSILTGCEKEDAANIAEHRGGNG